MKTKISLEPTELDEDQDVVTEIGIFLDRDHGEGDLREQMLVLLPDELQELYQRMRLYYEQGIWSFTTVEMPDPDQPLAVRKLTVHEMEAVQG